MDRNEAIATLCQSGTSLLVFNPRDASEYYVFSLHSAEGEVLYVGYDLMADIVSFKTLRKNPAFKDDQLYSIVIVGKGETQLVAHEKAVEYRKAMCGLKLPEFNMTASINRRMAVTCDQTGEVWRTAREACAALGIPTSNMSQHLNRTKGHRSVHGKTFSYVEFFARDDEGRIVLREKNKP